MKLPPLDDPSWQGFKEQHLRFRERYPYYEERMAEDFRTLAELRENQLARTARDSFGLPQENLSSHVGGSTSRDFRPHDPLRGGAKRADYTTQLRCRGHDGIVPLKLRAAAGSTIAPTKSQELPREWFPGKTVKLEFRNRAGVWEIRQHGAPRGLILTFWSIDEQSTGESLRIGGEFKELPIQQLAELAIIDIAMAEK